MVWCDVASPILDLGLFCLNRCIHGVAIRTAYLKIDAKDIIPLGYRLTNCSEAVEAAVGVDLRLCSVSVIQC